MQLTLTAGYAVGLISCLVPVYIADCAPARFRGALVSMYQYCLGLGLLLGVIVDYCTKNRTDSASFKIPIAVQFVFPMVLVPGLLLFVPESPRWLVQTNNIDKARRSITRLTGKSAERAEEEVTQLQLLHPMSSESSWRSIFTWGLEGRKAYLGCALQGQSSYLPCQSRESNTDTSNLFQPSNKLQGSTLSLVTALSSSFRLVLIIPF